MMPSPKTFSLRLVFVLLLSCSMLLLTLLLSYKSYTSLTASIIEGNTISTRYAVEAVSQSIQVMLDPAASNLGVLSTTSITQAETHEQRLDALPSMAKALKDGSMVEAVFAGYDTGDFFICANIRKPLPATTATAPCLLPRRFCSSPFPVTRRAS